MKLCKSGKCPKDKAIIQAIFDAEYQQMKEKALKALMEECSV